MQHGAVLNNRILTEGQKSAWHSRDSAGQEKHIQSRLQRSKRLNTQQSGLVGQTSSRTLLCEPTFAILELGFKHHTNKETRHTAILEATGSEQAFQGSGVGF